MQKYIETLNFNNTLLRRGIFIWLKNNYFVQFLLFSVFSSLLSYHLWFKFTNRGTLLIYFILQLNYNNMNCIDSLSINIFLGNMLWIVLGMNCHWLWIMCDELSGTNCWSMNGLGMNGPVTIHYNMHRYITK